MFITIKSKFSKKLYRVILLSLVALFFAVVIITACVFERAPKKNIDCENGKYSTQLSGDNGADAFVCQFSYEIDELVHEKTVRIPSEFSDVYEKYNELQLSQGLDLSSYKGKECVLSVYALKNYKIDYEKAYITILSKDNRVIGGHISTYQADSTLHSFFGE